MDRRILTRKKRQQRIKRVTTQMGQALPIPISFDISGDDYSFEISCTQEYQYLPDTTTPYTRLPHEITLRFLVQSLFVSSANPTLLLPYHWTREEISVPSHEIFSPRWGEAAASYREMLYIPFSLDDGRKINWIATFVKWDREGNGTRSEMHSKVLEDSQELASELVEYIRRSSDQHALPLAKLSVELQIKKLVRRPEEVVESWREWSRSDWSEYHNFVHVQPMRCLLRRKALRMELDELSWQGFDDRFDQEEMCCICMEGLLDGGVGVIRLKCSHLYHESCIMSWLSFKSTCPSCRSYALGRAPFRYAELLDDMGAFGI